MLLILKKASIILLLIGVGTSCMSTPLILNKTKLTMKAGIYYYKNKPFSGEAVKLFTSGKRNKLYSYKEGKKHCVQRVWYPNGQILSEETYEHGKKIGHTYGWHDNGAIRVQGAYVNDKREGEQWSWFPNGQLASYHLIRDGKEIGYKLWRADGLIYTNYVRGENDTKGLKGTIGCSTIKEI